MFVGASIDRHQTGGRNREATDQQVHQVHDAQSRELCHPQEEED